MMTLPDLLHFTRLAGEEKKKRMEREIKLARRRLF